MQISQLPTAVFLPHSFVVPGGLSAVLKRDTEHPVALLVMAASSSPSEQCSGWMPWASPKTRSHL